MLVVEVREGTASPKKILFFLSLKENKGDEGGEEGEMSSLLQRVHKPQAPCQPTAYSGDICRKHTNVMNNSKSCNKLICS